MSKERLILLPCHSRNSCLEQFLYKLEVVDYSNFMIKSNLHQGSIYRSGLKLLPYLVLGVVVFAFNSQTNGNYMLRGYFTLLEAQVGIVVIYFLMNKLTRATKEDR